MCFAFGVDKMVSALLKQVARYRYSTRQHFSVEEVFVEEGFP